MSKLAHIKEQKRIARGPPRQCLVCQEDCFLSQGLDCPASQANLNHGDHHFVCDECFSGHVTHCSKEEIRLRRKRNGLIWCPNRTPDLKCRAAGYSDDMVAKHVESEALQIYLKSRLELKELELAADMEAKKEQAIQAEVERLEKLSEFDRKVQTARRHCEQMLTLKCPRCNLAFYDLDFNHCFALSCRGCPCHFCAWCLRDCDNSQAAHTHVEQCGFNLAPNKDLWSTPQLFNQAHRERKERALRDYFRTLVPARLRQAVKQALRPQMRDLGLGNL